MGTMMDSPRSFHGEDNMGTVHSHSVLSPDELAALGMFPPNSPPANLQRRVPSHILLRMPNTAYGIALGLAGNSILWKSVGSSAVFSSFRDSSTQLLNVILWLAALVVGAAVTICYMYKALFHADLIRQEWRHPVRVHFMNGPHLLILLLAIGLPPKLGASQTALQILFGLCLLAQSFLTKFIYENWLFNPHSNISCAQPPFLLSIVGWFLLANLGLGIHIDETWGLALPQFCLGIGTMFYFSVNQSILNSLHQHRKEMRGSPSLTLLLTPPAVAAITLDILDDRGNNPTTFSTASSMALGWVVILFVLFATIGPRIAQHPGVLGEYWAYVFPLSAVATAFVRYATVTNTTASILTAAIFVSVAIVAFFAVMCRMLFHAYLCAKQRAQWGDPLLGISSTVVRPEPMPPPQAQSLEWTDPLFINQV